MRKVMLLAAVLLLGTVLTGCAMVVSPVNGMLYTQLQGPMGATSNAGSTKVGTAMCESYLGLVAMGDSSIEAAMKNGGITKVHHVDFDAMNILGIYAKFTVKVYGE